MNNQIKQFKNRLNEKEQQIAIALNKLKESYVLAKTNDTNESNRIYENDTNIIDNLSADIFKLQNSIIKSSNNIDKKMKLKENEMKKYKKNYNVERQLLMEIKNNGDASVSRNNEYSTILSELKLNTFLYSISGVLFIYLIYYYKKY